MAQRKASVKKKSDEARRKSGSKMIADRFDVRTLANMEVALERACQYLRTGRDSHEARRYIARKILKCAEAGDKTLTGLTEAGRIAATELSSTQGRSR